MKRRGQGSRGPASKPQPQWLLAASDSAGTLARHLTAAPGTCPVFRPRWAGWGEPAHDRRGGHPVQAGRQVAQQVLPSTPPWFLLSPHGTIAHRSPRAALATSWEPSSCHQGPGAHGGWGRTSTWAAGRSFLFSGLSGLHV